MWLWTFNIFLSSLLLIQADVWKKYFFDVHDTYVRQERNKLMNEMKVYYSDLQKYQKNLKIEAMRREEAKRKEMRERERIEEMKMQEFEERRRNEMNREYASGKTGHGGAWGELSRVPPHATPSTPGHAHLWLYMYFGKTEQNTCKS